MAASSGSSGRAAMATGRRTPVGMTANTSGSTSDKTGRPERREKAPDPNSPFAKLAALKAQLEAKERG